MRRSVVVVTVMMLFAACGGGEGVPSSEPGVQPPSTSLPGSDPDPIETDLAGGLADLPRMSLHGDPTVELEGGVCVLDAGDLILSIGYEPEYDARPQPEPLPHLLVRVFIRGRPGTWDTGSLSVLPDSTAIRDGDGGMVMTLSEDLLTGTFTWNSGSGSFSCPSLLSPTEAAAGPS